MVNKLYKGDLVAVVISPGYGAGWSSWAVDDERETMAMDSEIAQAVLDRDLDLARSIAHKKCPKSYISDTDRLQVEWIERGYTFVITDMHGHEHMNYVSVPFHMVG